MRFGVSGCVLDGLWGFAWILGAFLGERGRRVYPPLFWEFLVIGGVTPTKTVQKNFMETLGMSAWGGLEIYILCAFPFRVQKIYAKQGAALNKGTLYYALSKGDFRLERF